MALGDERLRSIVESLLLISPDPVPVSRLVEVIRIEDPQTEQDDVRAAITGLLEAYARPDRPLARGFRVEEVAGGLQLRTVAENAAFVRRYLSAKPQRLSKAALETLAIIAYRQPVTKPEVEAIRGVDAGGALRSLLERTLVKILGKKDEVGRPLIYGTTDQFLEFFGLKSLSELPTLREFHELDAESLEEVEALGGSPSVAELAHAAQFLVERKADPDLDALDVAMQATDAAKAASDAVLEPSEAGGPEPDTASDPKAGSTVVESGRSRGDEPTDPKPSSSRSDGLGSREKPSAFDEGAAKDPGPDAGPRPEPPKVPAADADASDSQ